MVGNAYVMSTCTGRNLRPSVECRKNKSSVVSSFGRSIAGFKRLILGGREAFYGSQAARFQPDISMLTTRSGSIWLFVGRIIVQKSGTVSIWLLVESVSQSDSEIDMAKGFLLA